VDLEVKKIDTWISKKSLVMQLKDMMIDKMWDDLSDKLKKYAHTTDYRFQRFSYKRI
jgi:hypothetical protein